MFKINVRVGDMVRLKSIPSNTSAKVVCYLYEELPNPNVVMLDRPINGTEFWDADDLEPTS